VCTYFFGFCFSLYALVCLLPAAMLMWPSTPKFLHPVANYERLCTSTRARRRRAFKRLKLTRKKCRQDEVRPQVHFRTLMAAAAVVEEPELDSEEEDGDYVPVDDDEEAHLDDAFEALVGGDDADDPGDQPPAPERLPTVRRAEGWCLCMCMRHTAVLVQI